MNLVSVIDKGEATAVQLEKIIIGDPGLCSGFLRIANVPTGSNKGEVSTVRAAIMRIGQRAVRSLAMSIVVQNLVREHTSAFDGTRFAYHSVHTAFLARYIFARQCQIKKLETAWSPDEIFASALMHDLGIALLAKVSPEIFGRIHSYAKRGGHSFGETFEMIYKNSISELGAAACESWGFPPLFADVIRNQGQPWNDPDNFTSLCCINYANFLTEAHGITFEEWPTVPQLMPDVENEVKLEDEEIEKVLHFIAQHAASYMPDHVPAPVTQAA